MKNIIYKISVLLIISLNSSLSNAQTVNAEMKDDEGNIILAGRCTRERLQQTPYGDWFNKNYNEYAVDSLTASRLQPLLADKKIVIFMGTWCGDSRREVPRVFKLLDYCKVPADHISLIMVSNTDSLYKHSPTHEERGLLIHHVPDVLIYQGTRELGRVVESPVVSLEKDLLAITNGNGYTPNYKAIASLDSLLNLRSANTNLQALADAVRGRTSSVGELIAFAHVLTVDGDLQKAGIVLQVNALLYPADAASFISLAKYAQKTGNVQALRANAQKALSIEPGNERARQLLQSVSN